MDRRIRFSKCRQELFATYQGQYKSSSSLESFGEYSYGFERARRRRNDVSNNDANGFEEQQQVGQYERSTGGGVAPQSVPRTSVWNAIGDGVTSENVLSITDDEDNTVERPYMEQSSHASQSQSKFNDLGFNNISNSMSFMTHEFPRAPPAARNHTNTENLHGQPSYRRSGNDNFSEFSFFPDEDLAAFSTELFGEIIAVELLFKDAIAADRIACNAPNCRAQSLHKETSVSMRTESSFAEMQKNSMPASSRVLMEYRMMISLQYDGNNTTRDIRNNFNPVKILPFHKFEEEKKQFQIIKVKTLTELGYDYTVKNWYTKIQTPKPDLYMKLRDMINTHSSPNIIVKAGGVTLNCHISVLQCYSDFFLELDRQNKIAYLPVDTVTAASFVMTYDWMLSERPQVQRTGIIQLYNTAHFMRVEGLIRQCWNCLDNDQLFREDTAFMLYLEARPYDVTDIKVLMLSRVTKFFLPVVASRNFVELQADEITCLLNMNTIGVNTEAEVFLAAIRWLFHDWKERRHAVLQVMSSVRFGAMPPWYLISLSRENHGYNINRITSHPGVKRLINDGISLSTLRTLSEENPDNYATAMKYLKFTPPKPRKWICDNDCTYHCPFGHLHEGNITYKNFLAYLQTYHTGSDLYRWRNFKTQKLKEGAPVVKPNCRAANCCVYHAVDIVNGVTRITPANRINSENLPNPAQSTNPNTLPRMRPPMAKPIPDVTLDDDEE